MISNIINIILLLLIIFIKCYSIKNTIYKRSVCIIGGGFGGLYTALKLDKISNGNMAITLVDSKENFVFLPLLYELAIDTASEKEVAPKYEELLKNSNIKFIQNKVNKIDPINKNVLYNSNEEICYDQIVLAVGSQPRLDIIPGLKEFSIPFYSINDAYNLRKRLNELLKEDQLIRVVVIGGGYSGVEVATSAAEYLGKKNAIVTIIDRNEYIMQSSPKHNRETAEKSLNNYGVSININSSVKKVSKTSVTIINNLNNEEYDIPADIVISTCGVQPNNLIESLNLKKDNFGRILTKRSLQSLEYSDIFALGDCSSIQNVQLPSTAQVAMQQSEIVANNLWTCANTNSESSFMDLASFQFVPLGEMLTLGKKDASVFSLNGLVELDGPLAAVSRRLVYAARMPTPTQSITALVNSITKTLSK